MFSDTVTVTHAQLDVSLLPSSQHFVVCDITTVILCLLYADGKYLQHVLSCVSSTVFNSSIEADT